MHPPLNEHSAFISLLQGDTNAFDFYYQQHHQPIYANIFKIVQDKTASQDILHDVFLALWEKKDTLRAADSVAGWLFVVSQHKSFAFLKQKVKKSTILLENPGILEQVIESPEIDEAFYQRQLTILEDAVNHLPKRKKEVFSLCRYEGRSLAYAAASLGISEDSARDYLKQSTRMIRQYIQEHYPAEMSMMGIALFMILQ